MTKKSIEILYRMADEATVVKDSLSGERVVEHPRFRRDLDASEQRAILAALNTRLAEPFSGVRVKTETRKVRGGQVHTRFLVGMENSLEAEQWDYVAVMDTRLRPAGRKLPARLTPAHIAGSGVYFNPPGFDVPEPPGAKEKSPAADQARTGLEDMTKDDDSEGLSDYPFR